MAKPLTRHYMADLHLGHPNVVKNRTQFKDFKEHDAFIVDRINSTVRPKDTLILAGDVAITEAACEPLSQILCQNIILVPGNHDGERCALPMQHFKHVTGAYLLKLDRFKIVVTHIPIHPCSLDRWHYNLHGHLHNGTVGDPRYLCISCEQVDYTPVDSHWIRERLPIKETQQCSESQ